MNSLESDYIIEARYPNTKRLLDALMAVKGPTPQFCLLNFADDGLHLKWEHESKAMQSGMFIGNRLFTSYSIRQETSFSLPLDTLLYTLQVIAPGELGDLVIRYPGPESELMLESAEPPLFDDDSMVNGGSAVPPGPVASIYARIRTTEEISFISILDHSVDPVSYFIGRGQLIKEAVDDMEWLQTGGSGGNDRGAAVAITLTRDPAEVKFSGTKENRSLEVRLPTSELATVSVAGPQVRWEYNFKHLKAVFANLGSSGRGGAGSDLNSLSKVAIDADGKLKVTHMLRLQGSGDDGGAGGDGASHPLATAGEAGDTDDSKSQMVVAQYLLMALCDEDQEAEGDDLGHGF